MFDNFKDEILAFTRRRRPELKRRLAGARITVKGYTLCFNTEVTRCLGVYLDTGFKVRARKILSLEKARRAKNRVCRLGSANGLAPGLIRKIQVAAVQAVTLYEAEL